MSTQAFPTYDSNREGHLYCAEVGMTLRDYFAAQVIGHLCASPLRQECALSDDVSYAYKVAKLMIFERTAIAKAEQ